MFIEDEDRSKGSVSDRRNGLKQITEALNAFIIYSLRRFGLEKNFPRMDLRMSQCRPEVFLSRIVTTDETWIYLFDPDVKQKTVEWRHSSSPRFKKVCVQKSAEINLALAFWGSQGKIPRDL